MSLVFPVALDGNHPALHRPVAVLIHKDQHLPYYHRLIDLQQSSVAVHRLRLRLHAEFVSALILSVHGYRYRNAYSQRSAPLFASKMKYGHERH